MPDVQAPPGDPITFAVIKNAMDAIVDEVAYTVIRTARSEIVKDVMDYSAAICDAKGEMVAQAKTIAQHLGAIPEAMAAVQAKWRGRLKPGDAVIMNDPYSGGMHLPDIFMFYPIFEGAEILAWSVVICHHTDVGGRVPGSNAADSTEIYQEGLRIPPLRLFDAGVMDETLEAMIGLNVRVPDRVLGDLRAQYAACQVGAREIGRLVQRYGAEEIRGYLAALLDYAERMARAEIATWPKGTYRFTDHIDSDGLSDDPVPLSVAITVVGDGTLKVDWAGTSKQVRAAINSTLSFTKSNAFLSVRCALRGDIPNNAGVFRCIEVTAPEGSVLNPISPAPVAARALTGYRVMDTMFGALAKIVPDIIPAAGEGGNTVVCLGGRHPDNRPFIVVDMISGCWGGRPDQDGIEAITNPSQNLSNTPVEVLERQHPVRIEDYALVDDSGGAGRFRGGMGLRRSYRLLADEAVMQLRADRLTFAPYGLNGGEPGGKAGNWLGEGDAKRPIPGKVTMTLRQGELLTHHQAGGGGHGDPLLRDPKAVARDVWNGKVSMEAARTRYGVAVDGKGVVDAAETAALRASRAQQGGTGMNSFDVSRRTALIATAGALAAPGMARAQAERLTVRLDFSPWGVQAAMHLAEARGWFREAGLTVDVQDGRGSGNTLQLVNAGQADVGQIQVGLIAQARDQGATVRAFAGFGRRTDLSVLVDRDSPITRVQDFRGKSIVVFAASPWAPFIDAWLRAGGLDRSTVNVMFVDPSALWGTYTARRADGLMSTTPSALPVAAGPRPSKAINAEDAGVAFPSYGLIATEATIRARGPALQRLVQTQQRAWEHLKTNPDDGVDAMARQRPDARMDRAVIREQIRLTIEFFDTPASRGRPIGWQAEADWTAALRALEAAGAIRAGWNAQNYFTNEFIA